MPTGSFWDVSNPAKPWGPLDPNGKLDIPYDWSDWLTEIGATIASHTMHVVPFDGEDDTNPVQCELSNDTDTQVLARISVNPALYVAATMLGEKFGITCRIVTSDGQVEDQTLWFKLVEK